MQMLRTSWTNPASAVARNFDVGFEVQKVEIWDLSTPDRFEWTNDMADASYFTLGTLAYTTSNGVTPLAQNTLVGAVISGFTNANPGVLTVDDVATFGFAAGDTIQVSGLSDDGTGTNSLNNTFTVASVTATTITTTTDTSTTGYSVYVSGGVVRRVTDTNGAAIPIVNRAIRGVTLGTGCVGGNNDSMVAIFYGEEPVV